MSSDDVLDKRRVKVCRVEMAMKQACRRQAVAHRSALKLALGDIGVFVFRPCASRYNTGRPVRWIVPHRFFLIIHDTHPTHTVRREARGHISNQLSFSPPRRRFHTIRASGGRRGALGRVLRVLQRADFLVFCYALLCTTQHRSRELNLDSLIGSKLPT